MITLKIHRAETGNDLSIEILKLKGYDKEIAENEGIAIANSLWESLPANTLDAMMHELERLNYELKNRPYDEYNE